MKSVLTGIFWFTLFHVAAASYHLVMDHSGQNFFNGWNFIDNWDNTTNGDVNFIDQQDATSQKLAYVSGTGNAIIKVDNSTNVLYPNKRNSIRMESTDFYPVGTLFIIDALHMPFGCSVWPSIWTKGAAWPNDGEIDIIEAVNLMNNNQMALHTQPGCSHTTPQNQVGSSILNDCSTGSGCTVAETKQNSYGSGFAAASGGVFAAQFDTSGIYIWFWSRADLPDSVKQAATSSIADTSSWGAPSAAYPSSSCDISKFFGAQQLVIDITLCGDWAGVQSVYQSTCHTTPTGNCTADNIWGPGSPRYDDAYFELQSIRVFSAASPSASSGSPSGTSSGAPSTTLKSAAATNMQWFSGAKTTAQAILGAVWVVVVGAFVV
ncbi:glycoside hydrolase family 16 protein [Hydnomerulius pinastri MD-312]|uniref:Glycoside hydrolase family 16 protein n=1 Tax=Hydnomerulius pinastri MD-312 TaxID=994086 RepID=A0A0C9W9G4_9AGAM|nr:glycoside hydrolase family 16 protein [Hydnomerulius pinastri MD-312]